MASEDKQDDIESLRSDEKKAADRGDYFAAGKIKAKLDLLEGEAKAIENRDYEQASKIREMRTKEEESGWRTWQLSRMGFLKIEHRKIPKELPRYESSVWREPRSWIVGTPRKVKNFTFTLEQQEETRQKLREMGVFGQFIPTVEEAFLSPNSSYGPSDAATWDGIHRDIDSIPKQTLPKLDVIEPIVEELRLSWNFLKRRGLKVQGMKDFIRDLKEINAEFAEKLNKLYCDRGGSYYPSAENDMIAEKLGLRDGSQLFRLWQRDPWSYGFGPLQRDESEAGSSISGSGRAYSSSRRSSSSTRRSSFRNTSDHTGDGINSVDGGPPSEAADDDG